MPTDTCDHRHHATSAFVRRPEAGGLVTLHCSKCGEQRGPYRRGPGMILLPWTNPNLQAGSVPAEHWRARLAEWAERRQRWELRRRAGRRRRLPRYWLVVGFSWAVVAAAWWHLGHPVATVAAVAVVIVCAGISSYCRGRRLG